MARIDIQFTLFSAFYTPLIAAVDGPFLRGEGFDPVLSVAPPGVSAVEALKSGAAQVIQTAPSQAFGPLARGADPVAVHFGLINRMDGFFLAGRQADGDFDWRGLEGAEVVLFGGGQPRAMFVYACHRAGIDFSKLTVIAPGGAAAMATAFRAGQGDFIQAQGPLPQQLEAEGIGHIVAATGPLIGENAFSSIAATREWLSGPMAAPFARGFRAARSWAAEARPGEVAALIAPRFEGTDAGALEASVAAYQDLGTWAGDEGIDARAFDVVQDVFAFNGLLPRRVALSEACVPMPG